MKRPYRVFGVVAIFACVFIVSGSSWSKAPETIEQSLRSLTDQIAEIRRDEQNYKIEKDLYKNFYDTHLNTVNYSISLITGLLAVLAFLGYKDIHEIRREYSRELERLKVTTSDFERRYEQLKDSQKELEQQSKTQGNKIKVLEIQETVNNHVNQRNFDRAFEYCEAGLDIAPEDEILLSFKSLLLMKRKNFTDSIAILSELLKKAPGNGSLILNLLECHYITNNLAGFTALYSTPGNRTAIATSNNEVHLELFDVLQLHLQKNYPGMLARIKSFAESPKTRPVNWKYTTASWDASDLLDFLSTLPPDENAHALVKFIRALNGDIPISEVLK